MKIKKLLKDYWNLFYTLEDYKHDIQDLSPEEFEEMRTLEERKKLIEKKLKEMGEL